MKETLRKRLEDKIKEIEVRCDLLQESIEEFKNLNLFIDAYKCKMKFEELVDVLAILNNLLD